MTDGIRCPECGSGNIAMVLYGMPAYDEELMAKKCFSISSSTGFGR